LWDALYTTYEPKLCPMALLPFFFFQQFEKKIRQRLFTRKLCGSVRLVSISGHLDAQRCALAPYLPAPVRGLLAARVGNDVIIADWASGHPPPCRAGAEGEADRAAADFVSLLQQLFCSFDGTAFLIRALGSPVQACQNRGWVYVFQTNLF